MSEQEEIKVETFQRQQPKTGKKVYGRLQSKQNTQTNQSRLGKNPGRQFFDSAEYSLHKDATKKEEQKESAQHAQNQQKDDQN